MPDQPDPKHPDVKVGHQVRHADGRVATVTARRSFEHVRVRLPDGSEDTWDEWEPVG